MFMPTRGENFGHIILESLQHGTPTLVSDQTPFTGCDGVEAVSLNQPKSFEESLLRWLMMDQSEYSAAAEKTKLTAALKNNTSPLLERYRNLFA
jgi:glycosyltransferase involved in cell wall biosynthesis